MITLKCSIVLGHNNHHTYQDSRLNENVGIIYSTLINIFDRFRKYFVLNMTINIVREWREFRRFLQLDRNRKEIVFYSESESYYQYFEPFIKCLIEDYGQSICYVTSSSTDPVLGSDNPQLNTFFIGENSIRTVFFATLRTKILVMTLLDLNVFHIKRSKHPVHYIYLPHSMVSTHMVFGKNAYKYYDSVFCVGFYQVIELRKAEMIYDFPQKTLVENGYARLDTLYNQVKTFQSVDHSRRRSSLNILIAPSWGPSGLLDSEVETLVSSLIGAGHRVTLRPHRHSRRFSEHKLDSLKSMFRDNPLFSWYETKSSSNQRLHDADLLVTDWSGSALSFAFALERPVLFINTPRKVNNPDYELLEIEPIEVSMRNRIGCILQLEQIGSASSIAEELCVKTDKVAKQIRTLREEMVFNFGSSAQKGAEYIANLCAAL